MKQGNLQNLFSRTFLENTGKFLIVLTVMALLGSCSKKETVTTEVFPPTLTFAEPKVEEEVTTEEEIVPEEEEKQQLVAEYVMVSSFLPASPTESYNADSAIDGNENTAWVPDGDTFQRGAWLSLHFPWAVEVQELWIYNGNGEYLDKYAPITEISLSFSTGEESMYGLSTGWNLIALAEPVSTDEVTITINNADTSKVDQIAVGEVRLFSSTTATATEQLGMETILRNMGALGDCSNITPEQAAAFATELQYIMAWAEETSASRSHLGSDYAYYTAEALLFAGGDGVPVLYYDYDFPVVDEMFLTKTDLVVWDGETAQRSYFEIAGNDTNINWILPGYVYENRGDYYFGLTEYDLYGSGSFGLIALVGFSGGMPKAAADYVAFICHQSRGAYTYEAELLDYTKLSYLSTFPTYQLATLVGEGDEAYFEFNGVNFYEKTLEWNRNNYNNWFTAIRQARIDAGYEQVMEIQSGDTVLTGLLAIAASGGIGDSMEEYPSGTAERPWLENIILPEETTEELPPAVG